MGAELKLVTARPAGQAGQEQVSKHALNGHPEGDEKN